MTDHYRVAPTVDEPEHEPDGLADIVDGLIERLGKRALADRASYFPQPDQDTARGQPQPLSGLASGGDPGAGLVGRESELSVLRAFIAAAAQRGDHLVWSGMPGIGKTALLNAAARLATPNTLVLRADGAPGEADIRFSGLNQLLRPVRTALDEFDSHAGRLLAVACGFDVGPAPDTQRVADAALALLRELSTARPVLVIVDDLQSVDPSTLATVHWVVRRCKGHAIGVLAAYRAGAALDRRGLTSATGAAGRGVCGRTARATAPDLVIGRASSSTHRRARQSAGAAGIAQGAGRRRSGIGPPGTASAHPVFERPLLGLLQRIARRPAGCCCWPRSTGPGNCPRCGRPRRVATSWPTWMRRRGAGSLLSTIRRERSRSLTRSCARRSSNCRPRGTPRRPPEPGRGSGRPAPPSRMASRRCSGRAG